MTDKARKRRREFAAANDVSCRTAANMMAAKHRQVREAYAAETGETTMTSSTTYEVRPCRYLHIDPTKHTQSELMKLIMLYKVYEDGKLVAAVRVVRPYITVAEEEGADLRVDCALATDALRNHLTAYFAPKILRFFEHAGWYWNDNGTYEEMPDPSVARKLQVHGYCEHAGQRRLHFHPLPKPMDLTPIWPGAEAVGLEHCDECCKETGLAQAVTIRIPLSSDGSV